MMIALRQKFKSHAADHRDIGRLPALGLMTGILLLAFALGARGLNLDPIWADELSSVTSFGVFDPPYGPAEVIASLRQYSTDQAPLYFVLNAIWFQVAGISQFALRLPSAFAGVLMLASLYRFVEYTINRRAAVMSVLLMSTNAFVLLYFHDMRLYTMFMLLAVIHSWFFWRLTGDSRSSWISWFLLVLTTALLFYTHNFAVILLLGLGICHLLFYKRSRRWFHVVAGWALGVAVFLPYAPVVITGLGYNQRYTANPLAAAEVIELLAKLLVNGQTLLWLPILVAITLAIWRTRNVWAISTIVVAVVMVAAILLINWRFNLITANRLRYFLIAWFLIVGSFAFGLTSIPHWRIVSIAFTLFWIVSGFQFHQSGDVIQYAGLMARDRVYPPLHDYVYHLNGNTETNDYLLGFSPSDRVNRVSRNSSNSISDYYLKAQLGIDGYFLHSHLKRYRLERDVRDILTAHPQVLLAFDPSDEPRNYARTFEIIAADYIPCAVLVDNPDLHIQRYAHPVLGCDNAATTVEYDNGIRVLDYAAQLDEQNERLQVLTWWEVPDESMLDQFNISLQIITSDWRNLRQVDRHLYDKIAPWNVIELSTVDLPAGDYRLMLILYERDSLEKVYGLTLPSGDSTNMQTLLAFAIGDQ